MRRHFVPTTSFAAAVLTLGTLALAADPPAAPQAPAPPPSQSAPHQADRAPAAPQPPAAGAIEQRGSVDVRSDRGAPQRSTTIDRDRATVDRARTDVDRASRDAARDQVRTTRDAARDTTNDVRRETSRVRDNARTDVQRSVTRERTRTGNMNRGRANLGLSVSAGTQGRVTVNNITRSSLAARAGIRQGDVLVSVGGRPVRNTNNIDTFFYGAPAGRRVDIVVIRDGRQQVLYFEPEWIAMDAAPQSGGAYLGVNLDQSMPNRVILTSVHPGSPAEQAGFRRGDEILAIDGERMTSPDHLSQVVGAHSPGDEVQIDVAYGNQTNTVAVQLGSRQRTVARPIYGDQAPVQAAPAPPTGAVAPPPAPNVDTTINVTPAPAPAPAPVVTTAPAPAPVVVAPSDTRDDTRVRERRAPVRRLFGR